MERDREWVALVGLAVALASPATAPRLEFQRALRLQLLAAARVQGGKTTIRRRRRTPRWGAAGLAAGLAASAVGVAASQANPGQPFYDLKRDAEIAQLQLAHGAQAKGRSELRFAAARLAELRRVPAGGPILATLRAMDRAATRGSDYLTTAAGQGDPNAAQLLADFARRQGALLAATEPHLPGSAQARAQQSRALLAAIAVKAAGLPPLTPASGRAAAGRGVTRPAGRESAGPTAVAPSAAAPTAGTPDAASPAVAPPAGRTPASAPTRAAAPPAGGPLARPRLAGPVPDPSAPRRIDAGTGQVAAVTPPPVVR